MREAEIKNPDPRKLLADLAQLIVEWRLKGYKSIVMGDFNSDKEDPDLEKFLEENNLIDAASKTNVGKQLTTYARGRRQIDYIFCDADLKKA